MIRERQLALYPYYSPTRREGQRRHSGNPGDANSKSIRLAFVRAHVAAGRFPTPGTPQAALVGRQKLPCKVTAAAGIARVECRAPLLERHRLSRASVLVQPAELGILVVEISHIAELAGTVAAQVVAVGGDRAGTVSAVRAVRDNTVLDKNLASRVAESTAAADRLGVVAKSRIADVDGSPLAVDGSSARRGAVRAEGTVRNGEGPRRVENRAAVAPVVPARRIVAECAVRDRQCATVADGATEGEIIVSVVGVKGRGRDRHRAAVVDGAAARAMPEKVGAIPIETRVADDRHPGVKDGAAAERCIQVEKAVVDSKRAGIADTSAARIADTFLDGEIRQRKMDADANREDIAAVCAVDDGCRRLGAVQRQLKRNA